MRHQGGGARRIRGDVWRGVEEVENLYTSARGVRACLEPSPVLLLTGIEAASGTNTDSMRSETPPEPYDDSAKAEQPRPTATVRKTHSSFDVEQNVLPKRRPERVEVGSVWTVRRGRLSAPCGQCDEG